MGLRIVIVGVPGVGKSTVVAKANEAVAGLSLIHISEPTRP